MSNLTNTPDQTITNLTVTPDQTTWTAHQRSLLTEAVGFKPTEYEAELMFHYSKQTGLCFFKKQLFAIRRSGKMTIQTSIDGFRIVATRACAQQNFLLGRVEPLFYDKSGKGFEVPPDALYAVKYTVEYQTQHGQTAKYPVVVMLHEFKQNSPFWKTMPAHMLTKCAEAIALRSAFPEALGGIYSTDEIEIDAPGLQAAGGNHSSSRSRRPEPIPAGAQVSNAAESDDPYARPEGIQAGVAKTRLVETFTSAGYGHDAAVASAKQIWLSAGHGDTPVTDEQLAALFDTATQLIDSENEKEVNE